MYHVISGPHVTEKSALASEGGNMSVFKVDVTATKKEIKKSIETLFEVKVTKVRTIKVKGKTKGQGQKSGKRKDWKKAYVTLAEGQSIGADQNP
jgi:large subunit ribosomal protein L23